MRWRAILFSVLCVCLLVACQPVRENPPLRIHVLDVGQGDAVLLRTSAGDVLIDAGPEDAEELLCLRLRQLGVRELALLIVTHPDADHVGGADGVLAEIPTKEILTNGAPLEGESAGRLLQTATRLEISVRAAHTGEVLRFGETVISVIGPIGNDQQAGNEGSLMLKVVCGSVSMLLMGDAGIKQEATLLAAYGETILDCDLYKVGHHGSNTSTSLAFLQCVTPTYAVISCGAANSYGHPFGEVLARLDQVGAEVLRTDLLGELVFETDGEALMRVKKT